MSHGHQDHDTHRWHDDGGALHPDEHDVGHVELPAAEPARKRCIYAGCGAVDPHLCPVAGVPIVAEAPPEHRVVIQSDTSRFGR